MDRFSRFFVKHFVPHRSNNHRPHLLRTEITFCLIGIVLAAEGLFAVHVFSLVPANSFLGDVFAPALVALANADRTQAAAPALADNTLLDQAAALKASDMAAHDYFAHVSPTGVTPWNWLDRVGYNYSYAGENLAINFTDSADVENAWMASPEHRANITSVDFTEVGVGVAHGTYQGKPATFVVEMFGTPAPSDQATVVAAVVPKGAAPLRGAATLAAAVAGQAEPAPQPPPAAPLPLFSSSASLAPAVLATSPRRVLSYADLFLVVLVLIAFAFIVWKGRRPIHAPLFANGLLLLGLAGSMMLLNATVFARGALPLSTAAPSAIEREQ